MNIEPIYHPYWLWEDSDMYSPSTRKDDSGVADAIKMLTNPNVFRDTARKVINEWKFSCEHNLTKSSINKIAYIGQASCFYGYGCKEDETRKAWAFLTEEQKEVANRVAAEILKEWEDGRIKDNAGHGCLNCESETYSLDF